VNGACYVFCLVGGVACFRQLLSQGKFHLVESSPSKILTLHALSARRGCSAADRKVSSNSRLGLPAVTDERARIVFRYTPKKDVQ
ncbi:methyltransferase domain protein, partial [Toxoplasma gondii FOU]